MGAEVSERLSDSPCALITSKFGWTGNMQKIIQSQTHSKTQDMQRDYYLNQKKTLEINPRHPLIKEWMRREKSQMRNLQRKMMTMKRRKKTMRRRKRLRKMHPRMSYRSQALQLQKL